MKTTKCYVREGHYEMGEPALMILPHKESGTHPARIVWESDYRKLMKLVKMIAAVNVSNVINDDTVVRLRHDAWIKRARALLKEKLK